MKVRILPALFMLAALATGDAQAQCSVNTQPSSYCGSPDAILSFTLNSIPTVGNNGCNSGSGYSFFSTPVRQLAPGGTYSFTATTGSYPEGFAIWIDLNGNSFFENSELLWTSSSAGYSHSGTITIPTTATGSTVRMRTKCHYNANPGAGDACTSVTWGETEDYWVELCKPPVLTSQPVDTFACEGASTQFSISATGAGAYQWQSNSGAGWTNVTNGTNFSGATTNTLTILNAPATLNLTDYRCIAMASCSNSVRDTSEAGNLTVLANTAIVHHTLKDTSCIGLQTKLYVKSDGVILNRKWQIWSDNDNDYIDVPPVPFMNMGDTLLIQNIPDTLNGALIRCIVEGLCGNDTTTDILLVVNAVPEVVTSPVDVTLDPGQTATFQIVAAGVGVKYQWQAGYQDTFANINEGGIYKGVKKDRLTVSGVSRVQDGFQFRCIVMGSGSCAVEPDTSNFGVLYVNPAVSVENIAANNTISVIPNPATGNSVTISATGAYGIAGNMYRVVDKTGRVVAEGKLDRNAGAVINITQLAAGLYNVQVIDNEGATSAQAKFIKL